jgi:hypothetical protein
MELCIGAKPLSYLVALGKIPMNIVWLVKERHFLEPISHDTCEVFPGQVPDMVRVGSRAVIKGVGHGYNEDTVVI